MVRGIAFLADLALAARTCDKLSVAGPADCHENRTVASSLKDALSIGWQNALVPFWREENIPYYSHSRRRQHYDEVSTRATDMRHDPAKAEAICTASPKTFHIGQLGAKMGHRHTESHFAYGHRTPTREVAVFEKLQG